MNTTGGTICICDNNDNGYNFFMSYFITERQYSTNSLEIKFNIIPEGEAGVKFFSEHVSGTYNNITEAINQAYPGNKDIRVDSDQNNSQKIYQTCETSLNFLNRLLLSYKSGTIFGYAWDGLLVKDILGISSTGLDEASVEIDRLPEILGGGTGTLTNITPYNLTYSRAQNYPIINPWTDENNSLNETFQDHTPKNVISVMSSSYFICRAGFEDMLKNYMENKIRLDTEFNAKYLLSGTVMPNNFRLGDIVKFKRESDESENVKDSDLYTKGLVYSNEVFIGNGQSETSPSGFKNFEWRTGIRGVEDGPWTQTINNTDE